MDILGKELKSPIVNTTASIFSKQLFQNQTQEHLAKTTEYIHACETGQLHFMNEVEPGGSSTRPVLLIGIRARDSTSTILSFIFKSPSH